MAESADPSELVRRGYNKIASTYLSARSDGRADPPVLGEFSSLLPANALVLDAGCGAGVPVTKFLAQRHRVVGIDFSIVQARTASGLVPSALIASVDMTQLAFPPGLFDGVCSFFAILHIPRSKHWNLLADFYRILRKEGLALPATGFSVISSLIEPDPISKIASHLFVLARKDGA